MLKQIRYRLHASYRRQLLDHLLCNNNSFLNGKVLDIGGGRKRGLFTPPQGAIWIYADINQDISQGIIADVQDMKNIKNDSFDSIKATELFEHVECPEKGLSECYRVLKKKGNLILSVPFLVQIHADPYDYQRWTETKWRKEFNRIGFKIVKFEKMGLFFTVLAEMIKILLKAFNLPLGIKHITYITYPILDIIKSLDNLKFVKKNDKLNKYTTGYFIVVKK